MGWARLLPLQLLHSAKRHLPRKLIKNQHPFDSISVFIGEALERTLRTGDKLTFSRDAGADFRYGVTRNSEDILSAGSVGGLDQEGPVAVWQEHDNYPNPNAEDLRQRFPGWPIAESIRVHKPHVTARVRDQIFHLLDGEEVSVDSYYVFLARSNKNVPIISFEFTPRAVHAAGRLDALSKELIIDAAQKLMSPVVSIL